MQYIALDPRFHPEQLGFIPGMLSEADPRSAREQLDDGYQHGGGWHPLDGWVMNRETFAITYPGDPPLKPFAVALLRRERLFFYPYSQVAIVQPDGSFEVCRMD